MHSKTIFTAKEIEDDTLFTMATSPRQGRYGIILGNDVSPLLDINHPVSSLYQLDTSFATDKLDSQITAIQNSLGSLTNRLDTIAKSKGVDEEVIKGITNLREQITELKSTSKGITARVILPPSEELEVKLITTNSLDRLEEYRSNQNIWAAGFGLFGGAVMGILVNFVTGAEVEKTAWVLVVAFILVTGIFAYFFYLDNKRVERVKTKFFQQITPLQPEVANDAVVKTE